MSNDKLVRLRDCVEAVKCYARHEPGCAAGGRRLTMGMYTEFHFNVELKTDTPQSVLDILKFMLDPKAESAQPPVPEHPFFDSERWRWLFVMDSYYFAADTHSTLRFDDLAQSHFLCVRSNIKNYNQEIERFVNWIMPWVYAQEGGFLGFHRYEESEDPVLIRKLS